MKQGFSEETDIVCFRLCDVIMRREIGTSCHLQSVSVII